MTNPPIEYANVGRRGRPLPTACPDCGFGGFNGIRCAGCDYPYPLGSAVSTTARHGAPGVESRGRSPQQAQLELLDKRWPKPPLTPRQKIVELMRVRNNVGTQHWYSTRIPKGT